MLNLHRVRAAFLIAVLLVALAYSASLLIRPNWTKWPIDYQVFWLAAQQSTDLVYRPSRMPFVYPPTALFLFKPLGWFPLILGYVSWSLLSVAAFALAVKKLGSWKTAAGCLVTPASIKTLTLGQPALLIGAALLMAVQMPSLAMGAIFGVVAAVKPQLVLFAPLAFMVRRDWQALGGMIASGSILLILSLLAFGPALWVEWLKALPEFHDVLVRDGVMSMVITPAGRAEDFGNAALPFLMVGLSLGTTAIIVASRHVENEMLVGLIVGASLVAAPYAHTHDTVALLPACIGLMRRAHWTPAFLAAVVFVGAMTLTPSALLLLFALAILAIYFGWCRLPLAPVCQDTR